MVEVTLDKLPAPLVALINRAKFQVAYHLPLTDRYVVEHVLPTGQRQELEYDVALGRCLTLAERIAQLPPARRTVLTDENVTVSSTYFIDPATSQLRLSLEMIDESGQKLLSTVRLVYVKLAWDEDALVQQALQRRRFPAEYATWSREQRIGHWAMVLHRYRRAHGESGRDEDEVYTLELIRDLERTEPKLRDMLADILTKVGRLEQTPPDQAIAAFTSRTGIAVGP
jgi:hypothetical protein